MSKPTKEMIQAVNRAAFQLSQLHFPVIRARLFVAVHDALAEGADWQAALQAAISNTKGK